jgi:polar amino acid transport system substrate-binding protein
LNRSSDSGTFHIGEGRARLESTAKIDVLHVPCVILSIARVVGCASVVTTSDISTVRALAPSGKLRVGLYPGTPTSIVGDPASGNARGVGFDLGRALAQRAGIPFEPVVFSKNAEVLASAKSGTLDMVFTNATPARSNDLDFSPTILQVELGYIVPADSAIHGLDGIDRDGMRIGVTAGSTSDATLSRELRNAKIVRTSSLKDAIAMLSMGELDAFATNKPTLFEMSDALPGSRVLDGRWGLENFAIGIPKGREAAMPLLRAFVVEAKSTGMIARAVERAGLRGALTAN